jgi:hypothetical protein
MTFLDFGIRTHFSFSFFDHPPSTGQVPSAVRGTPNVPSCDGVHYTFAGPTKVNHVTYWTKSDVIRPSQSNTFGTAVFFVREHYYYLLSGKLFFFAKGLRLLFLLLALTVQYSHTPVLCALCSVLCALCSVLCALFLSALGTSDVSCDNQDLIFAVSGNGSTFNTNSTTLLVPVRS